MEDTVGAFMPGGMFEIAGSGEGPLAGLAFAAKDIIDVAGHVTSCGNPDWARIHEPAAATAPSIQRCLDAGADFMGKTVTEELATGLTGENVHFGTPVNVNAPGRVAGGSSSGSAAAVAAGLVDFALGSDTGGSVRSPASFCGIYGIRPTHGRVPIEGVMPLAPSLDVIGWFARDPGLFARLGGVLLDGPSGNPSPGQFLVAGDVMARLDADVRSVLEGAIDSVAKLLGRPETVEVAAGAPVAGLDEWAAVVRTVWGAEAWATHGEWIEREKPTFGSGVAARFKARAQVTAEQAAAARPRREAIFEHLDALLADGAVLALPAGPGLPPMAGGSDADIDPFRAANEPIGAVAGIGRLPEVVLPLAEIGGVPLGLGLAAARGNDEMLLGIAAALGEAGLAPYVRVPE
jgi:amidase